MSLLERIRLLREKKGNISINRLEREAGLTRGSMAKWDDHAPSYDKMKKVADYLDTTVEYLLTGEGQKEKPTLTEDELDNNIIKRLVTLEPEELKQVDAFVQGILASRKE